MAATRTTKKPAKKRKTSATRARSKPPARVPLVDYLVLGANGAYLRANECKSCGARFFDRRNACAACGGREFKKARVKSRGELVGFSIVHRAAPGIAVPFVSGIVDCGGTTVRANVIDVEADPEHVKLGMKLALATYVSGSDDDGTECVAFGYAPA